MFISINPLSGSGIKEEAQMTSGLHIQDDTCVLETSEINGKFFSNISGHNPVG